MKVAIPAALALFFSAAAQTGAPPGIAAGSVEIKAFRCKTGCAGGKFRYLLFVANNSDRKAWMDRNDLKFKLKFSYKPARPKTRGARRGPAQAYKTIDFMVSGNNPMDSLALEPGEVRGLRQEFELSRFDLGLCGSESITLHGTIPVYHDGGKTDLEANLKIKGSCEF